MHLISCSLSLFLCLVFSCLTCGRCCLPVRPPSCCASYCSSHPACAKVAFTGSTVTGQRVAQAAIANLRPATMELGGKSCLIIFDDAGGPTLQQRLDCNDPLSKPVMGAKLLHTVG